MLSLILLAMKIFMIIYLYFRCISIYISIQGKLKMSLTAWSTWTKEVKMKEVKTHAQYKQVDWPAYFATKNVAFQILTIFLISPWNNLLLALSQKESLKQGNMMVFS